MRVWFSGRTRPCQGRVGSSILPTRTKRNEVTILCEVSKQTALLTGTEAAKPPQ